MQQDSLPGHGSINSISSATFSQSDGTQFTSLYSSIFPPKPSLSTSVSITPSDCSTDGDTTINSPLTIDHIQMHALELQYSPHSRLILEHQDLVDRHNLCLAHLHETAKEAEALRRENTNLRLANRDLNKRLSLLIQTSLQKRFVPSDYSSMSVVNGFRRLCIGDSPSSSSRAWEEANDESPTSVIESDRIERMDVERVALPKSISVRSSGYLKAAQAGGSNVGANRSPTPARSGSPAAETQKVYVRGGTREEEALELEVYSQGMFKTELCNKWQETGACPYGDHCQFAHGIKELRPVIRHPRYKTEVCRMVLAGDACPYGHRCHFRHALTEQEKFMAAPLKHRASN
ncbi:zinc finger CCCH domain-containing protein 15 [Malania oleifera]|uniref:zinc finger CCCH domain-containing protein 15 n=1 Tax=Malania oleifera TaxID=397392 RepID=UPI0025AE7D23|nr:zinc finger CCCH domain-containing protein 15 [Malania oleifera]XP_057961327.1 zinc finger CCCH domain-containing protein 15 [Malania oleifera]